MAGKRARGDNDDVAPPAKRQHGASNGLLPLHEIYRDLASETDHVRIEAAKQLIARFSPANNPTSSDISTALNRLIRGLCTQQKAARLGFCVALTELLRQLWGPSPHTIEGLDDADALIERIEQQTKIKGNVSGKERRDAKVGQLFAYKALIQSMILVESDPSLEAWTKLIDHLYTLAREVPWLREKCGLIIVEVVQSLEAQSELESYAACAQVVVERLTSSGLTSTPEGVAIWLATQDSFSQVLPTDVWHRKDPLSKKEQARLAKILREDLHDLTESGDKKSVKPGSAHSNPHSTWDLVLSKILAADQEKKENRTDAEKSDYAHFWRDAVDAQLFSSTASAERKAWGLKLFANQVASAPDWALRALFSPNLMRTLLNQAKSADRLLHAAAMSAWKSLPARVEQSTTSALPLFMGLTTDYGTADFDNFTKFKTLEQIMLLAQDDSLKKIVRHLSMLIGHPETSEQIIAVKRRQNIADLLLSVVRQYRRYGDRSAEDINSNDWLTKILDVLVEHAYFVPASSAKSRKVPLPPLSEGTRVTFRERLSSCLTRLMSVGSNSGTSHGMTIIHTIREKAASSETLKSTFQAEESVTSAVQDAFKTLDSLVKGRSKQQRKGQANGIGSTQPAEDGRAEGLILLYTFTLLQVFNGDGDAVLMLEDLKLASVSSAKRAKDAGEQGQDGFIEILLSFLGNPRSLFHKIAVEAFSALTSNVNAEGLRSLTDILAAEESLDGQNSLFAEIDEEAVENEDSGDDVDAASDVEMVQGDFPGVDASAASSEGGSSSDSDSVVDDDDDDDDEELTQFNNLLAMTLGTAKPGANGEAEGDTSDESDMDDEQMEALDSQLAEIFKQRSQMTGKKQRKDAKKNVVQFKSRILDLLAVFMDREYSSTLVLELLLPIVRLTRSHANPHLADKSAKLLKSAFDTHHKRKTALPRPGDSGKVLELLQDIHDEARQGGGAKNHAQTCSMASLFLVKVLVGLDRANYGKIAELYARSQKRWFEDFTSPAQPVLFLQFLDWSIQARSATGPRKGKKAGDG